MDHYILDANGAPRLVGLEEWAAWYETYETAERQVDQTTIGDVCISTVFLALDHSSLEGPPILWETMIFGGTLNNHQWRYTSRAGAEAGHVAAVDLVVQSLPDPALVLEAYGRVRAK